jgi:hypothetical protein
MSAALRCEILAVRLDATVRFDTEVLGFSLVATSDAPHPHLTLSRDAVLVGAAARGNYWRITTRA